MNIIFFVLKIIYACPIMMLVGTLCDDIVMVIYSIGMPNEDKRSQINSNLQSEDWEKDNVGNVFYVVGNIFWFHH